MIPNDGSKCLNIMHALMMMNWFILQLGVGIRRPDAVVGRMGGHFYTNTTSDRSIFPCSCLRIRNGIPINGDLCFNGIYTFFQKHVSRIFTWKNEMMIFSNVTDCLEIARKKLFPISPFPGLPTIILVWDSNIAWCRFLHNINELTKCVDITSPK